MVFKLQLQYGIGLALLGALTGSLHTCVYAESGEDLLKQAKSLMSTHQYFQAARFAFQASQNLPESQKGEAYSWVTLNLTRGGLYQSASYFFLRTLEVGQPLDKKRVLAEAENLIARVGVDFLRPTLLKETRMEHYDAKNASAYLYAVGKSLLLEGKEQQAIQFLNSVSSLSPLYPFALQLRGTARAIMGDTENAILDFRECQNRSANFAKKIERSGTEVLPKWIENQRQVSRDLENRCLAGEARVLYQRDDFEKAEEIYDQIPKSSFVWTDILFEQAWNAFSQKQYNRALGKLVSYKSPALRFIHNSEVEVLAAQSYLALCLYNDANSVINAFNQEYYQLGITIKNYVEANQSNLRAVYEKGRSALKGKLNTPDHFTKVLNRFVRSPYFQNLVWNEQGLDSELGAVQRFNSGDDAGGLAGFLKQVLTTRRKNIQELGGSYVKSSLLDIHQILISDFEKMSFIKLEMLARMKERLQTDKPARGELERNQNDPERKSYQYRWNFNGEFWNDELGDYVFGLESQCGKSLDQ